MIVREQWRRFKRDTNNDPTLRMAIRRELRGCDVVCFCAPLSCHGEIIVEIANDPLT